MHLIIDLGKYAILVKEILLIESKQQLDGCAKMFFTFRFGGDI